MTHDHYGHTTHHTNGSLTHKVSSNDSPHPDGDLKNTVRKKILYDRQVRTDKIPDPDIVISVVMNTSGRVYDDFVCLFFVYVYRESSDLTGELPVALFPSCILV